MMDNCCAPQWADFTCSPQLPSDSYFEIEHEIHNAQMYLKSNLKSDSSLPSNEENLGEESLITETKFDDSLEPAQDKCTNMVFFIPHDNKKQPAKETNNDNVKKDTKCSKSNKLYHAWNVSIADLTSVFKATSEPQRLKAAAEKIRKSAIVEMKNNIFRKPSKKANTQNALKKINSDPVANAKVNNCSEYGEANPLNKELPYKTVSAQRRQSDIFKTKQSQRKVLTCQYRRRSLMKYRRCSNQFVSMAEAVSKFQNGTPQRFRTISKKDLKPGPLMKLKRSPLKLTHPISPALRSKQRVRHTNVLSKEEREAMELEEMKKNQIKANPVPVNILKGPSVLKKVVKKPVTITEEFKLTQSRKTRYTAVPQVIEQCDQKSTVPISHSTGALTVEKDDKIQTHKNTVSVTCSTNTLTVKKDDKIQSHRGTVSMNRSTSASSVTKKNIKVEARKTSAPINRSTSASNVTKKDSKEGTHKTTVPITRSISASNVAKKENKEGTYKYTLPMNRSVSASTVRKHDKLQTPRNTVAISRSTSASSIFKKDDACTKQSTDNTARSVSNVLPYSFEARNKEFQMKREEKLKNLQEQETNKLKTGFHARPIPKFSKLLNSVKEPVDKKKTVVSCPFSFAERDKGLAKKKEHFVKQIQENNKKSRVFHANPAPTFKPVTVHGLSKENTQSKERNVNKECTTKQIKIVVDQENKQPNIIDANEEKKSETKEQATNKTHKKPLKDNSDNENDKDSVKGNQKKTVALELNSDKRAKKREEFDEKIRKREQEMEAKRQEEEKLRLLKEKSERAELRKLAEVKATPMPVYKPMIILKSTKMPTNPKDPKWASKSRLKNTPQV
ncbi:uncharacterized protein LOC116425910 [Nomia melanderi]|uniref:uncharacterized protein LOC116425910 n=1 Tax=Nomia melanderi TaxID=2448451 RepID=UPI003FCECC28